MPRRSLEQWRAIFARIKYGRIARDVGKVAVGAGAMYGAVKAYPHVRRYLSPEQRLVRRAKRKLKGEIRMFQAAERHRNRVAALTSSLSNETRADLNALGRSFGSKKNLLGSRREFVAAVTEAQRLQRMERSVRNSMADAGIARLKVAEEAIAQIEKLPHQRELPKPLREMSPQEQNVVFRDDERAYQAARELRGDKLGDLYLRQFNRDKHGNLLNPVTGKPVNSEDIFTRGIRTKKLTKGRQRFRQGELD